ncbi:MAG: hypothetical protein FJ398_26335 [Verrucomicrobia bacterium]|nr:hypothetical protein [Verrucomicrobiota bacterium]
MQSAVSPICNRQRVGNYDGTIGQRITGLPLPVPMTTLEGPATVSGGNMLGSWKHTFSEASELGLQLYYDRTERFDRVHRETRDTYDLDFQHRFPLGTRQEFMWGLGYRYTRDDLAEGKG